MYIKILFNVFFRKYFNFDLINNIFVVLILKYILYQNAR